MIIIIIDKRFVMSLVWILLYYKHDSLYLVYIVDKNAIIAFYYIYIYTYI